MNLKFPFILIKLLTFVIFLSISTNSQIKQIGIYGSADYNFNQPSNNNYPFPFGTIKTINFKPNTSIGWSAGLKFDYELSNRLYIGSKIGYNYLPLTFSATEKINIIHENRIIENEIQSNIKSQYNRITASIEIGYEYEQISYSLGASLGIPLRNIYSFKQSLRDNEDSELMNQFLDSTAISTKYSNFTYHPFIKISVIPGSKEFNSSSVFVTSLDFWSFFPLNSMTGEFNWKYSAFSLGFSFSFSMNKNQKPEMIKFDTVYYRDTTLVFDKRATKDSLYLKSVTENQTIADGNFAWFIHEYHQKWVKVVPKPHSLLNGELESQFVYDDGKVTTTCEEKYITNIYNWTCLKYDNKNRSQIYNISDTSFSVSLPIVRFYPRIISESGIKSSEIIFTEKFDTIKIFDFSNIKNNFIDINLNQLINSLGNEFLNRNILISLRLMDNDGQIFIANTGELALNDKRKNNSEKITNYLIFQPDVITGKDINKLLLKNKIKFVYYHSENRHIKNNKLREILQTVAIGDFNKIKKIIPANLFRDDLLILEIEK